MLRTQSQLPISGHRFSLPFTFWFNVFAITCLCSMCLSHTFLLPHYFTARTILLPAPLLPALLPLTLLLLTKFLLTIHY